MDKFKLLLAIVTVYRSNFKVLHWKAAGCEFHMVHDKAAELADELDEDLDTLTEIAMRYGVEPVSVFDAATIARDAGDVIEVSTSKDYSKKDFFKYVSDILTDVLDGIEVCLKELEGAERSAGAKSTLESIYDKYDKEVRYLNARRSIDVCSDHKEDDDDHEDDDSDEHIEYDD